MRGTTLSLFGHNEMTAVSVAKPLRRRAGRWVVEVAGPDDDAAIRRLLHSQSMDGRMRLAVRTEPSFFEAAAELGEDVRVLVARTDGSDEIGGLGVRAVRQVWLKGQKTRVGHLSYLRLAPECRCRRDLLRA